MAKYSDGGNKKTDGFIIAIIIIAVVACLGVGFIFIKEVVLGNSDTVTPIDDPTAPITAPEDEQRPAEPPTNPTDAPISEPTEESTTEAPNDDTDLVFDEFISSGASEKSDWNLILANPKTKLPEGYGKSIKLDIVQKNGYGTYKVDSRASSALKAMIAAAKKDGITLVLRSSFRTHERQIELYENRVKILESEGYSHEEALIKAATINALPGTSEHETGLAVDILSPNYTRFNEGFEKTKEFKWLIEHCADYGFILRYPKDKESVTGIIYEPWHYRYVGTKDAKKIMESGLTLEQYLERLPD